MPITGRRLVNPAVPIPLLRVRSLHRPQALALNAAFMIADDLKLSFNAMNLL